MTRPKALILSGYGINCEEETKFAFEQAGAQADIVHVNDLIDGHKKLADYQILAFPGGFSFGDDTGSGNAYANRVRNHLWEEVQKFMQGDKLAIAICNGFQIMVNLGLLPALDGQYGTRQAALVHNESARYIDRWVDLKFSGNSPWVKNMGTVSFPVAHGEGKFFAEPGVLRKIKDKGLDTVHYVKGEICEYQDLEPNPNGSIENIAGITDELGRAIGMMPHPERALDFTNLPNWTYLREKYRREGKKMPKEGPGMEVFRNGVNYFK